MDESNLKNENITSTNEKDGVPSSLYHEFFSSLNLENYYQFNQSDDASFFSHDRAAMFPDKIHSPSWMILQDELPKNSFEPNEFDSTANPSFLLNSEKPANVQQNKNESNLKLGSDQISAPKASSHTIKTDSLNASPIPKSNSSSSYPNEILLLNHPAHSNLQATITATTVELKTPFSQTMANDTHTILNSNKKTLINDCFHSENASQTHCGSRLEKSIQPVSCPYNCEHITCKVVQSQLESSPKLKQIVPFEISKPTSDQTTCQTNQIEQTSNQTYPSKRPSDLAKRLQSIVENQSKISKKRTILHPHSLNAMILPSSKSFSSLSPSPPPIQPDRKTIFPTNPYFENNLPCLNHPMKINHDVFIHPFENSHAFLNRSIKIDRDIFHPLHSKVNSLSPHNRNTVVQIQTPNLVLKNGILALAKAVDSNDQVSIGLLVESLQMEADSWGSPMQRVTAHFLDALLARQRGDGHEYREDPFDVLAVADALDDFCLSVPFVSFFMQSSIRLILHSIQHIKNIHVIDFALWYGKWPMLLRQLAHTKRGHMDSVRIRFTCVDVPLGCPRGIGPRAPSPLIHRELSMLADKLGIGLEFASIVCPLGEFTASMVDVRKEETVVVNFGLVLHQVWDESMVRSNPRDSLLRSVRELNPLIVCMYASEVDVNNCPFPYRVRNTLDFFITLFDSYDAAFPRNSMARHMFECIINKPQMMEIIACDNVHLIERPERMHRLRKRMANLSYVPVPPHKNLKDYVSCMLEKFPEGFTSLDRDDHLALGWKGIPLSTVSAWTVS